jgi:hypothetical protein
MLLLCQVVATLPFDIVCTVVYAGVSYGMAGLQPVAAAFGRYAAVLTVFHLIACQVGALFQEKASHYKVYAALLVGCLRRQEVPQMSPYNLSGNCLQRF